MKFLNFHLISLAFLGVTFFSSCSKDDNSLKEPPKAAIEMKSSTFLTAEQLESLHSTVQNADPLEDESTLDSLGEVLDQNFDYAEINGVDSLMSEHGIDPVVLEQLRFFIDNEDQGNVYELLDNNYDLTEEEALLLFQAVETYKAVYPYLAQQGISRDCAEAIVGTLIITTAGAVAVGGPVGLGLWVVAKGWSTYQLIRGCT